MLLVVGESRIQVIAVHPIACSPLHPKVMDGPFAHESKGKALIGAGLGCPLDRRHSVTRSVFSGVCTVLGIQVRATRS